MQQFITGRVNFLVVGLDLGKFVSRVFVMDKHGTIVKEDRLETSHEVFKEFFGPSELCSLRHTAGSTTVEIIDQTLLPHELRWISLDSEQSYCHAIAAMQALGASETVPLARAPANDPVWIKRLLDGGVAGVMAPAVNSAAEAKAAAGACRYAPEGFRGMAAPIIRGSRFGSDLEDYLRRINDEVLLICQIETPEALAAVDAIAAVPGVDMLFIGPFDLSAALGFLGQPDHPEVRAAIALIEAAAKAAGKALGGIRTPDRSAEELYAAGYALVIADCDIVLLRDAAIASVAGLKKAAGRS